VCSEVYDRVKKAIEQNSVKVTKVETKETQKIKPLPLNTVEATKLISTKLKISPEVSMAVMEKLYNQGFLSYPRTETTQYSASIDLRAIVNRLKANEQLG
jgi:DNA topoisomerase-3